MGKDIVLFIKRHFYIVIVELVILISSLALFLIPKAHYIFDSSAFEYDKGVYFDTLFDVNEPGIYVDNEVANQEAIIMTPLADLHPGSYKVYLKYLNSDNNNTYSAISNYNTNSVINKRINASLGIVESSDYEKELVLNTWQRVDGYRIVFNYSGNGYLYVYGFEIVETNWWKIQILIVVIILSILTDLVMFCRDTRDSKELLCYSYAFLLGLITSFLSFSTFILWGHDIGYHLGRMEELALAITRGDIPLRVSDYWLGGLGYASALFYCDIFLFPAALLRTWGATLQGAWQVYTVYVNLSTAFIGLYSFKKIIKSRVGALTALTLYMLSVYRLSCMYTRFAVGDYSAEVFLPLVLYGIVRIYDECDKHESLNESFRKALPFIFGVSGLVLTHIQTTLMTAILTLGFLLINIRKTIQKTTLTRLICSLVGVLMLNMWFIFPFLEMSGKLKAMEVGGREGMFRANGTLLWQLFNLFSNGNGNSYPIYEAVGNEFTSEMPFSIAPAAIGVFAYVLLRVTKLITREHNDEKLVRTADKIVIASLLVMYMTTFYFPWDFIEQLSSVTGLITHTLMCPWRFLGIEWALSSTLCGILCVILINSETNLSRYASLYIGLIAVISVVGGGYYITTRACSSEWVSYYDKEDFCDPSIIGGEYLPKDTTDESFEMVLPSAGGSATISSWNRETGVIYVMVSNLSEDDSYIDVPYLYYKGYRAKDEATGVEFKTASNGIALTRVTVPAGFNGKIEVFYKEPGYWRIYEIVSVLSLLFVVFWKKLV